MSKEDLESKHVLFQVEDKATYVRKLLEKMLESA